MDPDGLGPAYVPRPRPDLTVASVGHELVVHDAHADATHCLEPPAAVVWRCLDGRSSVAEVAADVADALGADRRAATTALLRFVRRFGRAGLLDGMSGRRPHRPPEPPTVRTDDGRPLVTPAPDP